MRSGLSVAGSDLRIRRLALVTWTASVLLLVLLIVGIYPAIKHTSGLDSIYGDLSPTLQALLGGSTLTSTIGYLNTQVFAFFLPAVLTVFAVSRGAATIAGEEEERTLDLLLAQPIARWALYLQKSVAVSVGVGIIAVAAWLPLAIAGQPLGLDLPESHLLAACLQMALFCLALALIANACAAASGRRAIGIAASAGYTIVTYVIYGVSYTVSWLKPARPFTLWRWYEGGDPLQNGIERSAVLVLLLVCVAALAAGAVAFSRRDLHG